MIKNQINGAPVLDRQLSDYIRFNKTICYEFTIIVPVYNEEGNIFALDEKLSGFISQSPLTTCVLFVNDCSTDLSLEKIVQVCTRKKNFYYLSLPKNVGLSGALKAGIDNSYSTYVGYMDADLQTYPEDFSLLFPFIEEFEMVMGIRTNRDDSFVKKVSSRIANSFRRFMTKDGIVDTGCPLKIIKIESAKRIPLFNGMHRFLPALIQLQNGKVKQIPVRHFPRMAGVSKFNLRNRLVSPFLDCFAYRWMKSRYINYKITETNIY